MSDFSDSKRAEQERGPMCASLVLVVGDFLPRLHEPPVATGRITKVFERLGGRGEVRSVPTSDSEALRAERMDNWCEYGSWVLINACNQPHTRAVCQEVGIFDEIDLSSLDVDLYEICR